VDGGLRRVEVDSTIPLVWSFSCLNQLARGRKEDLNYASIKTHQGGKVTEEAASGCNDEAERGRWISWWMSGRVDHFRRGAQIHLRLFLGRKPLSMTCRAGGARVKGNARSDERHVDRRCAAR
jgi:hypothetical protein